ncbi:DHHA2 domain-containing protein [Candidatus Nanohalobium constans]|uniref:Manganese-dependent inorganic pyrophosphatase n=1 Tax=Candidatus Nanohalobium constans TaxID=2565781 RepID=A0A5Q0UEP1_9ARCH|nr:DHHA2 domain-containing protein [Candidatus Nanohalobium constans]QGA80006.1 manganese-dependent inorganic pyrophosphatase [Candidatus Nanohalobium constans]
MTEFLVTSYSNPDLDGTACSFAYAEFLRKNNKEAEPGLFGKPDDEAKFLLEKLNLKISSSLDLIEEVNQIALVDASNLEWLNQSIDKSKISQIIDHREHNLSEEFDGESQIELVGAAATLIAEKFKNSEVEISEESAELLYCAIADNTVDFQANVTTKRDKDAADWLENKFSDKNVLQEIFSVKSDFDKPVSEKVKNDYYNTNLAGRKVGIAQIEALGAEKFIEENSEEILSVMWRLKQRENLDHVFLTSIDIREELNIFTALEQSKKILENALNLQFKNNKAKDSRMLLRKEIIPKVKEELE